MFLAWLQNAESLPYDALCVFQWEAESKQVYDNLLGNNKCNQEELSRIRYADGVGVWDYGREGEGGNQNKDPPQMSTY